MTRSAEPGLFAPTKTRRLCLCRSHMLPPPSLLLALPLPPLLLPLLLLVSCLPMPAGAGRTGGELRCCGYSFRRSPLPLFFYAFIRMVPLGSTALCRRQIVCEIAIWPKRPAPLRPEVEYLAEIAREWL